MWNQTSINLQNYCTNYQAQSKDNIISKPSKHWRNRSKHQCVFIDVGDNFDDKFKMFVTFFDKKSPTWRYNRQQNDSFSITRSPTSLKSIIWRLIPESFTLIWHSYSLRVAPLLATNPTDAKLFWFFWKPWTGSSVNYKQYFMTH